MTYQDSITQLLSGGTSLKELRAMMPQLTEAIKKKKATQPLPGVSTFLTAQEVKDQFNIDLEPDWIMKITPPANGDQPKISYIRPDKWEILPPAVEGEEETYVSPEGKPFTRAELEAQNLQPQPLPPIPPVATKDETLLYKEYWRTGELTIITTGNWLVLLSDLTMGFHFKRLTSS